MKSLLVIIGLLFCFNIQLSSQFWPNNSWWHSSSNVLENHPTAHFLGGGLVNILVRGPYITKTWRDTPLKRMAWCGAFQGAWEGFQVLEVKQYPLKYGVWDFEAALVGCVTTEGLIAIGKKIF